jgi:serine/threonine protein kinase
MKRCSICHTEYPDTFKICPQDGAKLDDETVVINAPTVQAVAPPADRMIGRTIAGRFRIERKLGEGGMGAVYKAEHVKMNRPCAIKILNSSALNDPEALPRFTREAQMSSRIDHPHAVTIYDYGESEDGLVYLAMEYVEGDTLTNVLERDGKFPLARALKIARQIGEALDAAHALTIVHRDLKPDNIMLTRKGADPDFVKVLDFGIAKMAESEDKRNDLTQAGLIIGTPFYMSPEQVGGDKLDPRSDVFSFALIVYEMLTGELPYGGQNTQAVMVSRLTNSPRPLRAVDPTIPAAIEAAVLHALDRDRTTRTPSAGRLVSELEDAAAGRGPDLSRGQTKPVTSPQPRPDTLAIQSPSPTPGAGNWPTVPVDASGAFHPQVQPQVQPPVYPTDRAPNPPGYGAGPSGAPVPFGMPPQQQQSYPTPQQGYQPFVAQPAAKKGGGAGLWIGLVLMLVVLGGAGAVGLVGYQQGWFSKVDAPGPGAGPAGGGAGPTTAATAEQLFQEGYELQSKSDNAGAIEKYRAAIAKQPQYPKAHRNLGAALINSKRYTEGVAELETAMQQDPTPNDQVFYNLGLGHFKLKNYAKAGDYFKRAAEIGKDPDAHALAGFSLENAGDEDAADAEYRKYLAADPDGSYAATIKQILAGKAPVPTSDDFDL